MNSPQLLAKIKFKISSRLLRSMYMFFIHCAEVSLGEIPPSTGFGYLATVLSLEIDLFAVSLSCIRKLMLHFL